MYAVSILCEINLRRDPNVVSNWQIKQRQGSCERSTSTTRMARQNSTVFIPTRCFLTNSHRSLRLYLIRSLVEVFSMQFLLVEVLNM